MNFVEAQTYLESLIPKGFNLQLASIQRACAFFNNPQNKFASIHISGTNGKGSTAALLSTILQNSGYKVGL